jgi:hypothetical protein
MALEFVDPDSLVSAPVVLPGSGKNVQITGWTPPESNKFDVKKSYGTPTKLLENVIQTESSGNPHAVNPTSGAMGLGQFMPETVAMLHKQGVEFNPFKADEAKAAMDYYISQLHKEHGGDYVKAMKAYGGFKTKDPEKYLDKVLEGVDLTENNKLFVNPESLPESTDIPESELQPKLNLTPARAAGLFTRGATPAVTGAAIGGTLAGPPGALAGSVALPVGDVLNTGINAVTGGINRYAGTNIPQLQMPSDVAQKWMTNAGLPVAQTGPERMIQTAGSAMGGTAAELPAMTRLATTATNPMVKGFAETLSSAPKSQIAAAAPSAVASQAVYEKTDNPYLAMGAGAIAGMPFGVSLKQRSLNAPSQEELANAAKNLYTKAENSGIQFNENKFADQMFRTGHELRAEGFTPKGYPGIDSVLNEMVRTDVPKDFTELQTIRKMIQGQQKSSDSETRRIASILKDKFDDYVLNAPDQHLTAGNPKGVQAWKDARTQYSRLKKAEIFDDMVNDAQFTNQSLSTSLKNQMNSLAKNDKRMRLFTVEEQKAIKQVAKGNVTQKTLDLISKFAPDTVMGVLSTVGTHALSGNLASAGLAGTSFAAKQIANVNKNNSVSKLADMMRLGKIPKFESRFKNIPATTLRGLLSGNPTAKE